MVPLSKGKSYHKCLEYVIFQYLTAVDVNVRLGLKPARQPTTAGVGQTVDKVSEEESLVRVAAERNHAVERLWQIINKKLKNRNNLKLEVTFLSFKSNW